MFSHERKDTITFNLNDFANQRNNWDKTKPHPMNTEVVVNNHDGKAITMRLATVVSVMAIFDEMRCGGAPGPAIDKFFNALRDEHGGEAVTRACNFS